MRLAAAVLTGVRVGKLLSRRDRWRRAAGGAHRRATEATKESRVPYVTCGRSAGFSPLSSSSQAAMRSHKTEALMVTGSMALRRGSARRAVSGSVETACCAGAERAVCAPSYDPNRDSEDEDVRLGYINTCAAL